MKNKVKIALAAALVAGVSAFAIAQVPNPPGYPYGTPPPMGFGAIDGNFIHGIIRGINWSYQYSVAAAGSSQTTATQLPASKYLIELDSGTGGFNLPFCYSGTEILVYNNSGATLTAYPAVANNPATAAQDTINGASTKASFTNNTALQFFCVKSGNWAAK